jgi:hypothetical protein
VLGFADSEAGAVGRFASEDVLFKQALGSLGAFYSHPHTLVWMLTAFPPDYNDLQLYKRGGNVAPYADRGWCFCEASWAAMVKDSSMVFDLGKDTGKGVVADRFYLASACTRGRRTPLLPSALEEELALKHFTNGKDDQPAVAELYRKSFEERFGAVNKLQYRQLNWGAAEAKAVAAVLAAGVALNLQQLDLMDNYIGDKGAFALAGALPSATALMSLDLSRNLIRQEGARALAGTLPSARALKWLNLNDNSIGHEGARALAEAMPSAMALKCLYLNSNSIGDEGARALADALPSAAALETLFLQKNSIRAEGTHALARALPSAPALKQLNLHSNSIGDEGARALAGALPSATAERDGDGASPQQQLDW